MSKTLISIGAAIVAGAAFAGGAGAATGKAPVLDREQLTSWYPSANVTCHYDSTRTQLTIDYGLAGIASLPYTGNYGTKGTAMFAIVAGNAYLTGLTGTFTLQAVTGTIALGPGTKGSATCEEASGVATFELSDAAYTALLPDGTTDTGLFDLQYQRVDNFSGLFDSTRSPEIDGDRDGIWDGDDNCETVANADQRDTDKDFIGDACDNYDNRPALTLLGELWADTKNVRNGNKLVAKVDHAITALQNGQTAVACSDLASYIDQVRAARGKTIPAASADLLLAKAQHIRVVLVC